MEFSRQEYWRGLPFPSPGDFPNPGIKPGSPALQVDSLPSEPPEKLALYRKLGNNSYYVVCVLKKYMQSGTGICTHTHTHTPTTDNLPGQYSHFHTRIKGVCMCVCVCVCFWVFFFNADIWKLSFPAQLNFTVYYVLLNGFPRRKVKDSKCLPHNTDKIFCLIRHWHVYYNIYRRVTRAERPFLSVFFCRTDSISCTR